MFWRTPPNGGTVRFGMRFQSEPSAVGIVLQGRFRVGIGRKRGGTKELLRFRRVGSSGGAQERFGVGSGGVEARNKVAPDCSAASRASMAAMHFFNRHFQCGIFGVVRHHANLGLMLLRIRRLPDRILLKQRPLLFNRLQRATITNMPDSAQGGNAEILRDKFAGKGQMVKFVPLFCVEQGRIPSSAFVAEGAAMPRELPFLCPGHCSQCIKQ